MNATLHVPSDVSSGGSVSVNFHGGGFVMRHPEQDDALCRYLAAEAVVTVVNVDDIPGRRDGLRGDRTACAGSLS